MKLALISDLHSNLEALTAVLQDIEKQQVDRIHCLGDVIGYGSDPAACLELVKNNCEIKLMGNHEYVVLDLVSTEHYNDAARISARWTKEQLTDYELSIIADFEMQRALDDVLLVHASPNEPDQWYYVLVPGAAREAFSHLNERICFFGHTHVPQIYIEREEDLPRCRMGHTFHPDKENRYLINVGSVGQPRDNDPRACYVTFDTDAYEVMYHRVEYDIETTQGKMSQANLPEMLINRLSVGR